MLGTVSKTVRIRNVPDELHRTLKSRAAIAGLSLSDYLVAVLRRSAQRPTREELSRRLESREPVELSEPATATIRAERDER